ncbi:MAG: flagellar biosynthetic protein FliR [Candidatus Methylomirabilales bacterium]
MSIWEITARDVPLFFLAFLRSIGFLFSAPILGSRSIPPQVRVGLSLLLALVLFPQIGQIAVEPPADPLSLTIAGMGEIGIGITLGYATRLLFAGALMAGDMIGHQTGLHLTTFFDPQLARPMTVAAQFLDRLLVLVFLAADGHHLMLQAIGGSFHWVPLFSFALPGRVVELLIQLFGSSLMLALKLAAPILTATFVVYLALALLGRAIPHIDVVILGFPVAFYVGFLIFFASLPLMVHLFGVASSHLEADLVLLLRSMSHALR